MEPEKRAYSFRKRQRSCDRCRLQKLKCRTDTQDNPNTCQRCLRDQVPCVFSSRRSTLSSPRNAQEVSRLEGPAPSSFTSSRPLHTPPDSSIHDPSTEAFDHVPPVPNLGSTPIAAGGAGLASTTAEQWTIPPGALAALTPGQLAQTQISQKLDKLEGHCYQVFGTSSEADPWLLRHCRYDENGFRRSEKVHIRNAGGVPFPGKIPCHFMVYEDSVCEPAIKDTKVSNADYLRSELETLVPSTYGPRLLGLFMNRVFPLLPILSRTELGYWPNQGAEVSQRLDISKLPTHLLAAVYGSALPFSHEDSHLSLLMAYNKPPMSRIWRIVYELIQEELHKPQLSVIQAAILYLHRQTQDESTTTSAPVNSPFVWTFLGVVVGLAHTLGLNLECRFFGLPQSEKRLRRRLWWAVYNEDKWMSLMLGRPPYIRREEWDVEELTGGDFRCGLSSNAPNTVPFDYNESPFRQMARLSCIAEEIQTRLYSLKASQNLADNLHASVEIAKPLLHQLNTWQNEAISLLGSSEDGLRGMPACMEHACFCLLLCTWRALLRTTVRSEDPTQIIDIEETHTEVSFLDNIPEIFYNFNEDTFINRDIRNDNQTIVEEVYSRSLRCASTIISFAAKLASPKLSQFWYSWSTDAFAMITNFIVVLIVQAPNLTKATEARRLLEEWKYILNCQVKVSPLFTRAKIRLDSYLCSGLEATFRLPDHVQQALSGSP